uniref:Uncharacterized protein n=1 Tax=Arundo donax TaxID=35708 RepID=A0A0A9D264_ARUDO
MEKPVSPSPARKSLKVRSECSSCTVFLFFSFSKLQSLVHTTQAVKYVLLYAIY